jgi:hypothetical protein
MAGGRRLHQLNHGSGLEKASMPPIILDSMLEVQGKVLHLIN